MTSVREVVIGGASPEDGEAICAIYNVAIAERGSTFETAMRSSADFQERISDTHFPLLVAKLGDDVVGWAGLGSYSSRPCYAGIAECSVYVDAETRGRGIGTALAEALASTAENDGFHKLIGKLFTDNTASIRLVERCGFTTVGLHRRHGKLDDNWRDVLVVELLLNPAPSTAP
jgi:L-amino acid N-acyltransferase YncA